MTFRSLDLELIYDNATGTIFEDLFNPLLSRSVSYKRGVGYFSSSWLLMCAEGLQKMAEKQGKILLITSPHLSERDWDAFRLGNEARKNEIVFQSLSTQVEEMKNITDSR